ncbi:hypothetical protein NHF46_08770 [Arthrobacter alpinus]|nr:hypothetical protein [Arthrobacter alpinus]
MGAVATPNPSWINDQTRRRSLAHLGGHAVDVAVVGGGITGVGWPWMR